LTYYKSFGRKEIKEQYIEKEKEERQEMEILGKKP